MSVLNLLEYDLLLAWDAEGEGGMSVFVGEGKIALGDDVHPDDDFVVFVVVLKGEYVGYDAS